MWQQFQSLKLNEILYTKEALLLFANKKLSTNNDEWEKNLYQFILEWLNESDKITAYTSGSTGIPKKISLNKNKMAASANATIQCLGLHHNSNALLCLPCNFIAGKMMVVRAFVGGYNMVTVKPNSNPFIDFENSAIDFVALAPNQAVSILTDETTIVKLENVNNVIIGGGAISAKLLNLLNPLPNNIFETFGMTETMSHIALKLVSKNSTENYFTTLEGIKVSTNDKDCLVIDAPLISDTIIETNDIVSIINEHQFIWKGRSDNVINSAGIKLYAEAIEQQIASLIPYTIIIGSIPDTSLNEKLILLIETSEVLSQEKIFAIIKAKLKTYECPKAIYALPYFVKTENGKIKRAETMALIKEAKSLQ